MRIDRKPVLGLACVTILAIAAANGCVSNDTAPSLDQDSGTIDFDTGAPTPGVDAVAPPPSPDASVPDSTVPPQPEAGPIADATQPDTSPIHDATPPPDAFDAGPQALLRIAYLDDPDYLNITRTPQGAGPKYDVCVAVHGTNGWQGPLLQNAGSPGLSLFDVSTYFSVPPGQYDVRVLALNGTTGTCSLPDGGDAGTATDFTALPAVTGGERMTVVALPVWSSSSTGSINVVGLVDEGTVTPGKTKIRFTNASSTSTLDYGLGGGDVFMSLFTQVDDQTLIAAANADAGTNAGVSANGYLEVDPFTQIDTTAQSAQGSLVNTATSPAIDAPAGTILSAFAVYSRSLGATGLLVCNDTKPNTANPFLSSCTPVAGANGNGGGVVRFTNFISDKAIPNVDFCIKYHSMASYGPTSVGGGVEGVPFATGSERYDVHAGFTYDVRLVAGSAPDCSTGVAPDFPFVAPAATGTLSTVVLTGSVAALDGGSPTADAGDDGGGLASTAFAAFTLTDLGCVATETPPSVRIVNVASATGAPQNASLTGGSGWGFTGVPYGGVGTTKGTDACGYLSYTATTGGFIVTQGEDSSYDNTDQTETLYLFSLSSTSVEILACDDNDTSTGACSILPPGG